MTINNHADTFEGRNVIPCRPEMRIASPKNTAYVVRANWESDYEDFGLQWKSLLADPRRGELEALILGAWSEDLSSNSTEALVQMLVDAAPLLLNLKALFFPDLTYEDNEISWIVQSNVSPVLEAYPHLEVLRLRGGNGLQFNTPLHHSGLKKLIIETGGLSAQTVRQLCAMTLPNLTHLELWFGAEDYGGTVAPSDIAPILSGKLFPKLKFLGLMNSDVANDIAQSLAGAPILQQIEELDLSMGTMTNEGAQHILANPDIKGLKRLNVEDNFLDDDLRGAFKVLGPEVCFGEHKDNDDDWFYCSVAE